MAFQHITPELVLASVQAIAAGRQPAIDADLLLALYLPEFLGLKSSVIVDTDLATLSPEFQQLQRRFHAQAVESWGVLGNGTDFVLVTLGDGWQAVTGERDAAIARGLRMCGTIGLTADGCPLVLTEPDDDADSLRTLLHACLLTFWQPAAAETGPLNGRSEDASAAWLRGLWALPDTRNEGGFDA